MTFEQQKEIIKMALEEAHTPLEWFENIIETAYTKGCADQCKLSKELSITDTLSEETIDQLLDGID